MKNKSCVFEWFNEFRALAENQCGQLVKCLRSHNGGEYVSRQFEEYMLQSGISWHIFVPHTPKHNGVTEGKNRTLVEMAMCLLQDKDLSMKFWAEVVYCAN